MVVDTTGEYPRLNSKPQEEKRNDRGIVLEFREELVGTPVLMALFGSALQRKVKR